MNILIYSFAALCFAYIARFAASCYSIRAIYLRYWVMWPKRVGLLAYGPFSTSTTQSTWHQIIALALVFSSRDLAPLSPK
jgi:hypothetical protein